MFINVLLFVPHIDTIYSFKSKRPHLRSQVFRVISDYIIAFLYDRFFTYASTRNKILLHFPL